MGRGRGEEGTKGRGVDIEERIIGGWLGDLSVCVCLCCSGGVITSSGCCYVSSVSKAYVLVCRGVNYASKY